MAPDSEAARSFARAVLGRERIFGGLRAVLPVLAGCGIEVMPLKGVLLDWVLYGRGETRPMSDADLLVKPADFAKSTAMLAALGGRIPPRSGARKHPIEFHAGKAWWTIDLHCDLWSSRFVPLDVVDAWNRASREASPYGVTLQVPPREFTLAHAAAHFAKSGLTARNEARAGEIGRLLVWALEHRDAESLVSYLARSGAVGATRYALSAAFVARPRDEALGLFLKMLPIARLRATFLDQVAQGRLRIPSRLVCEAVLDRIS